MATNSAPGGDQEKLRSLFSYLRDFKEVVAIVIFFVGGVIWLYAAFATKQYVAEVKCLLGATIERIDNEAQAKTFQAEIIEHSIRLERMQSDGPTSPNIIGDLELIKQKIEDLKTKKSLADEVTKKASQRVINGECGG
ncbi:hypothetical protein [Mesorhizobium sp.]|uniref:hypothetical protein n=1 Tax=Mesorhizobium sp. TaxID=1871066 RepID=UPI000FEA37EB|nr:hypothetical protein [Mesorhizobium sp.]RWO49230.1 MAG: hypothetical protein EOS13_23115 [Mesorhizobium sp.]